MTEVDGTLILEHLRRIQERLGRLEIGQTPYLRSSAAIRA
jgi:hypothetical protein